MRDYLDAAGELHAHTVGVRVCNIRPMRPATPDVLLLDLDGTLTDAAPGILNCIRYALDSMGVEHPDDAAMRTFLGPPLVPTFRDHFGMSAADVDTAIALYRERYHDVGLFENEVYDGIPDLLAILDQRGLTLAVATSKPTYSATRILEHFDLAQYLAFIGGSDLEGIRHDKAAVIAHTLAELALLGRLPDGASIIMVGDREHDVYGARSHGIDTIGVLWGYGDADELQDAGAVALAATPDELGLLLA
jgi:phosphoglycolate phosphatase